MNKKLLASQPVGCDLDSNGSSSNSEFSVDEGSAPVDSFESDVITRARHQFRVTGDPDGLQTNFRDVFMAMTRRSGKSRRGVRVIDSALELVDLAKTVQEKQSALAMLPIVIRSFIDKKEKSGKVSSRMGGIKGFQSIANDFMAEVSRYESLLTAMKTPRNLGKALRSMPSVGDDFKRMSVIAGRLGIIEGSERPINEQLQGIRDASLVDEAQQRMLLESRPLRKVYLNYLSKLQYESGKAAVLRVFVQADFKASSLQSIAERLSDRQKDQFFRAFQEDDVNIGSANPCSGAGGATCLEELLPRIDQAIMNAIEHLDWQFAPRFISHMLD
ncbi:MAG: hypothetical protein ACI9BD_000245 [Candidatus Marinamargulisbacteria bacterium]|jgi:hypothetical protein